jgi:hypothetical protein
MGQNYFGIRWATLNDDADYWQPRFIAVLQAFFVLGPSATKGWRSWTISVALAAISGV